MNKLESLDTTLCSTVNSNMSGAILPKSAMDSLPRQDRRVRDGRGSPASQRGSAERDDGWPQRRGAGSRNEAQTISARHKTKSDDSQSAMYNSTYYGAFKSTNTPMQAQWGSQALSHRAHATQDKQSSNTYPFASSNHEHTDQNQLDMELMMQQDSALVEVNNHQKSLKDRLELLNRQEEEQLKRVQDATPRSTETSRREESPQAQNWNAWHGGMAGANK